MFKPVNKTLVVFIFFDLIFLGCAVLHLLIPLLTHASLGRSPTVDNVASDLLLDHCPLTASMVNSFVMFFVFALSLPALFRPRNFLFLQLHALGIVMAALLTLIIGLIIWFQTLETHNNLAPIWNKQTPFVQSMLQFKFTCCGYRNPALFVQDQTCPNSATAARLGPCMVPFGVFANQFLDVVFTTFFGFVAVDMILLLSVLCVIKERREKERYRFIDEKRGYSTL
jgi:hypothetical protein